MDCQVDYDGTTATVSWHEANETYTFTPEGRVPPANPAVGAVPTVDHLLARLDELGIYNLSPGSLSRLDELQQVVDEAVGPSVLSSSPVGGVMVLTPSGRVAATAEFIDGTAIGPRQVAGEAVAQLLIVSSSPFTATDRAFDIGEVAAEFARINQVTGEFSYEIAAVADWVDSYRQGSIILPLPAGPHIEPQPGDLHLRHQSAHQQQLALTSSATV